MLRIAGWLLISGAILKSPEQGMALCFFFAPFFWYSAGSFKLFFTLKPFQLTFFLTVLACFFSKREIIGHAIKLTCKDIKNWLLLGFLLSLYLAIFLNHADQKSVRLTLNLTLLIAWFFLASGMIRTPLLFEACLKSYLAGSALIVGGISLKGMLDRGYSIFEGHNAYGDFLLFCIPLTAVFFVSTKSRVRKFFLWLFFSLLLPNLFLSFSRSALIACLTVSLGVILFFILKKRGREVLMLLGALCLPLLVAWYFPHKFGDPPMTFRERVIGCVQMAGEVVGTEKRTPFVIGGGYQSMQNGPVLGTFSVKGKMDAALKFRFLAWRDMISEIKKNPFWGKGLYLDGHSVYVDVLYSAGVLGAGCFFLFLLFWCYQVLCFIIQSRCKNLVYPAVGVFAGVTAWLIQSYVETYFLLFYIWAFLAAGAALSQLGQREAPLPSE
ncbi:MAG TPA: O-antigen ligase family protein [Candidatus Omnitrophota bacterium]|nr:O-antigen ligase family protein [Candidatus Omnitrophota bacterium]